MAATAASSSSSTPTLDVNNSTGTSHVSFAEGTAAATPVTPLTSTSNVSAAGDTRRRSFIESARKSIDGVRSAIVGHLPHLPGLPRKSTEFSRRSTDRSGLSDGDDGLLELAGYEGMWILDRAVSESDDGLLKMQGCSMIQRMTAKRLTFYTKHSVQRHENGHPVLVAHVTADIPFVDFVYENILDGVERELKMPSLGQVKVTRTLLPDRSIHAVEISADPKNAWQLTSTWKLEGDKFVKESEAIKGKEVWKGRMVWVRK